MPRNGSGVYSLPAGNPVVSGTTIASNTWANPTLTDVASEITSSLDRAGRGGMTAQLKLFDGVEATPGLAFTNEPTSGWYRASAGTVGFSVLGANRFTLNATGLGLGVTPLAPLHVKATGELARLETTTARGGGGAYVNFYDPTGQKGSVGYTSGDDQFYIVQGLNANLNLYANGAVRMIVGPAGNVGMSTSGAAVLGSGVLKLTGNYCEWQSATYHGYIGQGDAIVGGAANSDFAVASYVGNLLFSTNSGAERARIDSSGNVIVGATTQSGIGSGTDLLSVKGTVGFGDGTASPAQLNGNSTTFVELVNRGAGGVKLYTNSGGVTALTASTAGVLTDKDSRELGWKNIPRNTSWGTIGEVSAVSAGFTVANGNPAGTAAYAYNDSASAITITQGGGLTLRLSGTASTGNRQLAPRGWVMIWYNSTSEAICVGDVT